MPEFAIDYLELARMKDEVGSFAELPAIDDLLNALEAQPFEITLADAVRLLALSTEAIALANRRACPAEVF